MALHAKDPDADPDWLDEWPLGVRRPFMASQAFNVLQRDLRRYLRGEVAGRSILISGHRGAGKTALVARAIQDCEREVMTDAVRPIDPRQRSLPPQRPLLVKLHGPTLLAIDAPKPAAPAEPIGSGPAVVITATAGAAPAKAAEDKADKPAATTLSLITIALYRALAAEAAKAYAIHAREEQGLRGGDFAEVAGSLCWNWIAPRPPARSAPSGPGWTGWDPGCFGPVGRAGAAARAWSMTRGCAR
jgi:hypothetical protein